MVVAYRGGGTAETVLENKQASYESVGGFRIDAHGDDVGVPSARSSDFLEAGEAADAAVETRQKGLIDAQALGREPEIKVDRTETRIISQSGLSETLENKCQMKSRNQATGTICEN